MLAIRRSTARHFILINIPSDTFTNFVLKTVTDEKDTRVFLSEQLCQWLHGGTDTPVDQGYHIGVFHAELLKFGVFLRHLA